MRSLVTLLALGLFMPLLMAQTALFESTKKKAETGDMVAQRELALIYRYGREGVPRNQAESLKWLRKAAVAGDAAAQVLLGLSYASGSGVPMSKTEPVKWYRKAADQGHALGEYYLGMAHLNGLGVPQRESEAAKWLGKAAVKGDSNAQNVLGQMYAEGRGVRKDEVEALAWLTHGKYMSESQEMLREALKKKLTPEQLSKAAARREEIRAESLRLSPENAEPRDGAYRKPPAK